MGAKYGGFTVIHFCSQPSSLSPLDTEIKFIIISIITIDLDLPAIKISSCEWSIIMPCNILLLSWSCGSTSLRLVRASFLHQTSTVHLFLCNLRSATPSLAFRSPGDSNAAVIVRLPPQDMTDPFPSLDLHSFQD